jgi:hypothetical protein
MLGRDCFDSEALYGGWKPKSRPAASAQYPPAPRATPTAFALGRPRSVHLALSSLPRILDTITIVRPETIVRWHRMGFAAYWRWKSRPLGGRPRIGKEVRDLIRTMSFENPLWGAPRIHGELLNLGADGRVARTPNHRSVSVGLRAEISHSRQ